jgi:hypothetical protein
MSNHAAALKQAIGNADQGLSMWGWDAAASALLQAGVKVEIHPTDLERHPVLDPFKVELTTRLWSRDPEEGESPNVIWGSAYGENIHAAFAAALADLTVHLTEAQTILTDKDIWP